MKSLNSEVAPGDVGSYHCAAAAVASRSPRRLLPVPIARGAASSASLTAPALSGRWGPSPQAAAQFQRPPRHPCGDARRVPSVGAAAVPAPAENQEPAEPALPVPKAGAERSPGRAGQEAHLFSFPACLPRAPSSGCSHQGPGGPRGGSAGPEGPPLRPPRPVPRGNQGSAPSVLCGAGPPTRTGPAAVPLRRGRWAGAGGGRGERGGRRQPCPAPRGLGPAPRRARSGRGVRLSIFMSVGPRSVSSWSKQGAIFQDAFFPCLSYKVKNGH